MKTKLIIMALSMSLLLAACGKTSTEHHAAPAATAAVADEHAGDTGHAAQGQGEGAHEEAALKLTPKQQQASGIELAELGAASIRESLPLYGVIVPNAERVREVAARYPGVIRSVGKRIGETVRQGEVLATVESNESLQTYAVTAPLAGVITARNANAGEQTGDKSLFTVADLSTVWVELSLFPRDVAKVRVDQQASIRSPDADLGAVGKVIYVAPFGDRANQTLTARVLLDNPQRRWAPGLYVSAELTLAQVSVPLAVRNDAVQMLEGREVVFVQEGERFVARPVRLGRSDGEYSELLSGLAAGERYVSRNSYILKAELGKGSAEHEH